MSRNDSDSFLSGEDDSPVKLRAEGLLSRHPTHLKYSKSKAISFALRVKLKKRRVTPLA